MWLAGLLVPFCSAASFTNFPNFKGNRVKLEILLAAAGTLAPRRPQEATCLDDIFPTDLLVAMFKALPHGNQLDYGALLEDLSPSRFDLLCNEVQHRGPPWEDLVTGYPRADSKWKQHFNSRAEWQNARTLFYKRDYQYLYSLDYVMKMADHSDDIFDHTVLGGCLIVWAGKKEYHVLVRKICAESPHLRKILKSWLPAYEGYEGEYIVMLLNSLKMGRLDPYSTIHMPPGISLEQLQPLVEIVKSCRVWKWGRLATKVNDSMVKGKLEELEHAAKQKQFKFNDFGLATVPFLGEWPMAEEFKVQSAFPLQLNDALDAMVTVNNELVLQNSLALASQLTSPKDLCSSFAYWLPQLKRFTPRVKKALSMLKPYLTLFEPPHPSTLNWKLLPLYEDMVANPDDYWRDEIKEAATAWAKESVSKCQNICDSKLKDAGEGTLICLAADPFWRERAEPLLKERIGKIDRISVYRDGCTAECVTVVADLWLTSTLPQREVMKPLFLYCFENSHHTMVMTAKTRLLDRFLKVMPPQEMLSLCKHQIVKKRLKVMLHLNPKVHSYQNHALISKNSLAFRDWVLAVLPCNEYRLADLKLLYYYFNNRIYGAYPNFEILQRDAAGACAFGLLGNPDMISDMAEKLTELHF